MKVTFISNIEIYNQDIFPVYDSKKDGYQPCLGDKIYAVQKVHQALLQKRLPCYLMIVDIAIINKDLMICTLDYSKEELAMLRKIKINPYQSNQ